MATPIPGNILYYSLPNGTLVPILDANGQYVPASSHPAAIPTNIIASMEPLAPAAATTTAAAATPATQSAPQQQQQQQQRPSCVLMYLQKDGSYGLKRDL